MIDEGAEQGEGGLLDGVRVLDLSRLLPGPAATAWLAAQGARVDRVEPPGGDPARHMPPFIGEQGTGPGAFFDATHRGKRSLALDLRHPEAGAVLRRLVPAYDVLVEGFKPGVLEAMGIGPDVLLGDAPHLVIARLSGFGQTGPWADRPGHDLNYLGLSGALAMAAPTAHGAAAPPVQVADLSGALVAAAGIASALAGRWRAAASGRPWRGRVLDVSLAEAALWVAAPHVLAGSAAGEAVAPGEGLLAGGLPTYDLYRCADGRLVAVGALEPKFQAVLAAAVGGVPTREALAALFATAPRDHWVGALADACVTPVLDEIEVVSAPPFVARDVVRPGPGGATRVRAPLGVWAATDPPARAGADTDAVLADGGFDAEAVAALRARGVVR